MPHALADDLTAYGVAAESILDLKQDPSPELMRYLDLLATRETGLEPDAVIEAQRQPLAYVIDGLTDSHPITAERLLQIRRRLAFRGDAPYMAVVRPGELTVYELALDTLDTDDLDAAIIHDAAAGSSSSRGVFQTLAMSAKSPRRSTARGTTVHELLFRMLSRTIDGLYDSGLSHEDAVSLAGRALFMRFLLDRGILAQDQWASACPGCEDSREFFLDAKRARASCRWLDRTFNGDFLPLSIEDDLPSWERLDGTTWDHLSDVMHRSHRPAAGQLTLGDWSDVDFAHVPVGVLSEVYEHQAKTWEPERRRKEAQYYTPRRLAEYMVDEVFRGLAERGPCQPAAARVLDPAAGAGVFLTAALRELVAAKWRVTGQPPTTAGIRGLLYGQLTGFDINESALRLAALSLYLTAIDVDPYPHPVEALRFECLRGRVLHLFSDTGDMASRAGSLGRGVGPQHAGRYDVVIGNPPWTSLPASDGPVYREIVDVVGAIAADRLGSQRARSVAIADRTPDVPFFWRSLEWARPDGWIALLMHARLLFKQSEAGRAVREDLFASAEVTGVLNGADLAGTAVWPNISAPFCMVFARNRAPENDYPLLFVSPYVEPTVNRQGRLRIDALDAHPISYLSMVRSPHLMKVLFRGTPIDSGVLDHVSRAAKTTLGQYWRDHRLAVGEGYQLGNPDQRRRDASHLVGLPELAPADATEGVGLVVDDLSRRFGHQLVQWPRKRHGYAAPLLLVPEALRLNGALPRAHVADQDVVFSESFRGYSAAGHPFGHELVRYVALLVHSRLYSWHALLTSGKFGVDRRIVQGRDVDATPFIPLEDLPVDLRSDIPSLLRKVAESPSDAWELTDEWMGRVYDLDEWELEAMRDCVDTGLPFKASESRAVRPPTESQVHSFIGVVQAILRDAGCRCSHVRLTSLGGGWEMPWVVLDVVEPKTAPRSEAPNGVYRLADDLGASRVILSRGTAAGVRIGLLREYRYWTPTRARLLALTLLSEHGDSLGPLP